MDGKGNSVPGKMKLPRALELLNALIGHMIEIEGGHPRRVIETLLTLGFTSGELVEDFCFSAADVETAESEDA